jgi:hypothetical protein
VPPSGSLNSSGTAVACAAAMTPSMVRDVRGAYHASSGAIVSPARVSSSARCTARPLCAPRLADESFPFRWTFL